MKHDSKSHIPKKKDIFFEDEERVAKKNLRKKRKLALIVLAVLIMGSACYELISQAGDKDRISAHMQIRLDSIVSNISKLTINVGIPQDGVGLKKIKYVGKVGDTALTMLERIAKSNELPIVIEEDRVISIGEIKNGVCGEKSYWMFAVNGEIHQGKPGEYVVKQDDNVVWTFTTDEGKDIDKSTLN